MAFPVVASAPGFASTDAQREVWDVTAEVPAGTALIAGADRVGVAYTPSGGHVGSKTIGDITISGFNDGGASLSVLKVSAATDGSWEFPVTGVVAGTKNGVVVYAIVAAGNITELTLTAGSNVRYGTINSPLGYTPSAAKAVVKVGA